MQIAVRPTLKKIYSNFFNRLDDFAEAVHSFAALTLVLGSGARSPGPIKQEGASTMNFDDPIIIVFPPAVFGF